METKEQQWVCKFGGSSLANAKRIANVKQIVLADPRRRFIVVSAPGKEGPNDTKITDLLLDCHQKAVQGVSFEQQFDQIRQRIRGISQALGSDEQQIEHVLNDIQQQLPKHKTSDYALSRGEYLNALMIAPYLEATFVDATDIIFLSEEGTIEQKSYDKVRQKLAHIEGRVVIPGFYGTGVDSSIKTFSRGGSDISGALVAKAVGAALYENWTDVSGIYNADPNIVASAQPIELITYKELRQLSLLGASVFHEDAIEPVNQAAIPIKVKNTNAVSEEGTLITVNRSSCVPTVAGVTGKRECRLFTFSSFMLDHQPNQKEALRSALKLFKLKPLVSVDALDAMAFYCPIELSDTEAQQIVQTIQEQTHIEEAHVSQEFSLVGVVGTHISSQQNLLTTLDGAFKKEDIAAQLLSPAFNSALVFSVPPSVYERALRTAIKALF